MVDFGNEGFGKVEEVERMNIKLCLDARLKTRLQDIDEG